MKEEILKEYTSLVLFEKYPWLGDIQYNTVPWVDHITYLSQRENTIISPMGLNKPLTFRDGVLNEWRPYFNKFYSAVTPDKSITIFMGFQFSNTELVTATTGFDPKTDQIKVTTGYYGTSYGDFYRFIEKYQDYVDIPEKKSLGFI